QADASFEDVVLLFRDLVEKAAVDRCHYPERRPAVMIKQRKEFVRCLIELPRTLRFKFEQWCNTGDIQCRTDVEKFFRCQSEAQQILFREIEAAHLRIFFDVADNVRELEGDTAFFRQSFGMWIAVSVDANTYEAHN